MRWVSLYPVAAQSKGGLYPPLMEAVQQLPGKPSGRAVVKGQGHVFRLPRLGRQTQKGKGKKNRRQSPPHGHALLKRKLQLSRIPI